MNQKSTSIHPLLTMLVEHSWNDGLTSRLLQACRETQQVVEVSMNLLDVEIDVANETVTLHALWADDDTDEIPSYTLSLPDLWRVLNARDSGQDWQAVAPTVSVD